MTYNGLHNFFMFVVVTVSLFELILEEVIQRDADTHMYLGTIVHKFWVSMSTFLHLLGIC